MAPPIYYQKETDPILFRRSDGDPGRLPDEILGSAGWEPVVGRLSVSAEAFPRPTRRGSLDGGADPKLWVQIDTITLEEAVRIARSVGVQIAE